MTESTELRRTLVEDRIRSERDFHNARYGSGQDTRAHLNKYYIAIKDGEARFQQLVRRRGTNRTVLEYGCADGVSAIIEMRTPEFAAEYYGIDISDAAIAFALHRSKAAGYKNCIFQTMNAEHMTFADEHFDLVYGHGILHHLDLGRSFAELRRTLKTGGSTVFMEPLGHNAILNWYRSRTTRLRTHDEHPLFGS